MFYFLVFFLLWSHIKNRRYSRAAKFEPRPNQKTVGEGAKGGNTFVLHIFRLRPWLFVWSRMNPRPSQDTPSRQAGQVMDRLVKDVNTVQWYDSGSESCFHNNYICLNFLKGITLVYHMFWNSHRKSTCIYYYMQETSLCKVAVTWQVYDSEHPWNLHKHRASGVFCCWSGNSTSWSDHLKKKTCYPQWCLQLL